jgi:hypothetical protein
LFIEGDIFKLPDKWFWNKAWKRKGVFHLEARASYNAGKDNCETKIVTAKSTTFEFAYQEILTKIKTSKWKIMVT